MRFNSIFSTGRSSVIRGFSLPELMITMFIFVTLSVTMLMNYNNFSSKVVLETEAHDIALSIRQAQVYAMGVKSGGAGFSAGYGLYFDKDAPGQMIMFRDKDGNGVFTHSDQMSIIPIPTYFTMINSFTIPVAHAASGPSRPTPPSVSSCKFYGECVEVIKLPAGVTIDPANMVMTNTSGNLSYTNSVHITFVRPKPDAMIKCESLYDMNTFNDGTKASIQIKSTKGTTRRVEIWMKGQVAIKSDVLNVLSPS